MNSEELADLTLEELVQIQQRLTADYNAARQRYKAAMKTLQPYLDAAWAEDTRRKAAQAPPHLNQRIG